MTFDQDELGPGVHHPFVGLAGIEECGELRSGEPQRVHGDDGNEATGPA